VWCVTCLATSHLQGWHRERQAATKEAHVSLQLPIACLLKCLLLPPA
jgi:uncharacterized protein YceK